MVDFRRKSPFISETVRDSLADGYYGTLIGSRGCRIEWYHFRWTWMTPNPGFIVTVYLQIGYLKTVCFRDTVTKTLIGNHTRSIEWYHFQWPRVSRVTLAWISRSRQFLKSNIRKTVRLKDKVTSAQEETIPNIWNGVWWPWLVSKCVVPVCQHQLSFLF